MLATQEEKDMSSIPNPYESWVWCTLVVTALGKWRQVGSWGLLDSDDTDPKNMIDGNQGMTPKVDL